MGFQVCIGAEIPVHRFMLSCRSPVFKAMFQEDNYKENQTGEILVKDVEPEVMLALVK